MSEKIVEDLLNSLSPEEREEIEKRHELGSKILSLVDNAPMSNKATFECLLSVVAYLLEQRNINRYIIGASSDKSLVVQVIPDVVIKKAITSMQDKVDSGELTDKDDGSLAVVSEDENTPDVVISNDNGPAKGIVH